MVHLPSYAEVLKSDPERLDPNDFSGKVKYLPHWPKIHPDHKPDHLNEPENQWIFGHPVMVLSREPSEKGNVDVCVLRTFHGRGLQVEHGTSLQSRFYLLIYPGPARRFTVAARQPLTCGHPFTGYPTTPVLDLINPEYRILKTCWVNLRRIYTVPYFCLEDFMWSDNTTVPTLTRTAYMQMVLYQRDVVPGLLMREEVETERSEMGEVAMAKEGVDKPEMAGAVTDGADMVKEGVGKAQMEKAELGRVELGEVAMVKEGVGKAGMVGAMMEQAKMGEASSTPVGSETSSAGFSSGTVSSGGST